MYQCGGCGATLRAKNRPADTHDTHLGSRDVASTGTTPDATTRTTRQETNIMPSPRAISDHIVSATTGDVVAASASSAPDVATSSRRAIEEKGHDQSTNYYDSSEFPGVSVTFPRGSRDTTCESRVDTEKKRRNGQAESPDAATKKHSSGEAAVRAEFRDREEPAPKSAQEAAESKPSRRAAAAAQGGGKVRSPPRHDLLKAQQDLAPLRDKILKAVDALKGDLTELFTKSPDLRPTSRPRRPPRLPKQQGGGHAPRRDAAAVVGHHFDSAAARGAKHGGHPAPLRGLPSRRYRRCRAADPPYCDNAHHHHGCCCRHRHHGNAPECGGHCGSSRPVRARDPSSAPRKPPPRHHCRPVLKGAPFIICSSCLQLVQVPAGFAVATNTLRRLRCGSCSAVLTYSYRDPARKKPSVVDQFSTGDPHHVGDDPFVDGLGLSSYSTTEDEQPLHVSRNTSFDTLDGAKGVGRLHRLMGYGSASDLLLLRRGSPDLYESFHERTTPDYDRKGKAVCIDDSDDSDDEGDSGVLKRGAVWPLPGKGAPAPGAIRIKS